MEWNERYKSEDTPWDRGEPAPPLVEYMNSHSLNDRIIVPGCGSGSDVRFLAAQGCDVLGVDIAPRALQKARSYPLPSESKAHFEIHDFLDPNNELPSAHFDTLFEHTCFCAIEPTRRLDYVLSAKRLLKPNGRILAILFTDLKRSEGPPHPSTPEEIEELFIPDFEIEERWRPGLTFPGRENEESMYLMKLR